MSTEGKLRMDCEADRTSALKKLGAIIETIAQRGRLPKLAIVYGKLLVARDLLTITPIEHMVLVQRIVSNILDETYATIQGEPS